ncbi:MAG: tetratricopeptide repeat protein [Gammaproteobacteria bacterium]
MPRLTILVVVLVLVLAGAFACTSTTEGPGQAGAPAGPVGATLLQGLGSYSMPVTSNATAQRWFDQGLNLSYGFNHDAAERSFLKAAEADPDCAMCWWGAALVLGPHVNATMDAANNGKAWDRVGRAARLANTDAEKAWVKALTARYSANPPADRKPLDEAYATAMGELVRARPDDLDAATLHAEALMDLAPWNYYDVNARPMGRTNEFVGVLESVLKRNPDHPGALHLYIHAVEASTTPERGAAAADRLRALVPGSGHLVHMPAHIYTRVGRYHDAVIANEKAAAADDVYLAACRPAPGTYPLGYVPHNHHFLWWAASMEGASAKALAAAEETRKRASYPDLIKQPGYEFLQDFWATPIKAQVQFGKWDTLLASPAPPAELRYATAIWQYGQGMARVRKGQVRQAQDHLEALAAAADDAAFDQYFVGPKQALSRTLKVAERLLAGEIAAAREDYPGAVRAFERAIFLEDTNAYFEPPLWHQPARLSLGALLLRQKRFAEAEKMFREDLLRNRANGWSLYGLARSLKAQGKPAYDVEKQFQDAWAHADVALQNTTF